MNSFNLQLQLKDTEPAIKNKLINLYFKLRGFKFVITLVMEFNKIKNDDKTKFTTFYSNSKAEKIVNEKGIDDIFETIYTTIISNIQNILEKVLVGLLTQL